MDLLTSFFRPGIVAFAVSVASVACGGGGGSGSNSSSPPAPPPPAPPTVPPANQSPTVDAGLDQIVVESDFVDLVGSAADADGTIASVQWVQVFGPEVELSNPEGLATSFEAPRRFLTDGVIFSLRVRDDDGAESSDEVVVFIEPDFIEVPINHGSAYFKQRAMPEPIEFLQLDIDPDAENRIVLRSYLNNDDIEIYSSRDLLPENLVTASYLAELENDVLSLPPGSPTPVYLAVFGWYRDQYTVTLDERGEFVEEGFPVEVIAQAGVSGGGAESRNVTVANIDADPELEILFSAASQGPLYAFNHDGTLVPGWPAAVDRYTAYPSVGNLAGDASIQEIALGIGPISATCHPDLYLLDGAGGVLSGWPQTTCSAGTLEPPLLIDLDHDGIDEVFFSSGLGFYANGPPIPGWDGRVGDGMPAVADVSGDGEPDFVFSIGTALNDIEAYDLAGNPLSGFPIVDDPMERMLRGGPVGLVDFDGDGRHEIVRFRKPSDISDRALVEVYDSDGTELWETFTGSRLIYTTVPAFGDLDGDGLPEFLLQTSEELYAWRGDGTLLPGFPVTFTDPALPGLGHTSAPLIGDVTGDGLPNVVVSDGAFIWVFDAAGSLLHQIRQFSNVVSAIADVDLDGRNEIVVGLNNWDGTANERFDSVWMLDLGGGSHGPVQWGQVGGSPRRHFSFPVD